MPSQPTDILSADFLQLLRELDGEAWGRAFEVLYPIAVRGAVYANTHLSEEDKEEVVSDALADLARQIHELPTWTQVTAFTFVTAQRRSVDRLRQLRAQKRHVAGGSYVSYDQATDEELITNDVRALAKWAEVSGLMDELVASLGEPAASLVRGYTADGLSYDQLARRANMPLGTVAAIIYRSMRRLERELRRSSKLAKELSLYLRLVL